MADAGYNRLHFLRCEVLRFIDYHKLVGDAPSADIAQGLNQTAARAHQVVTAAMLLAHVQIAQKLERVVDRLHPWAELFLERSWQESEFLSHGDRWPCDHQASELAVQDRSLQAGCHCHQGLPGA